MPPLPRGLIMIASVWLFFAWIASMGVHPPVQPSTASYTPGVRMMVLLTMSGLFIGWPLLRLSQAPSVFPVRSALLDLLVLLCLSNLVLWPLRLVTPWPAERVACLMLVCAGWLTATGALISAATGTRGAARRTLAMAGCLLLALGWMPLRLLSSSLAPAPFPSVLSGPIEGSVAIVAIGGAPASETEWAAVRWSAVIAAVLWAAALVQAAARTSRMSVSKGLPQAG